MSKLTRLKTKIPTYLTAPKWFHKKDRLPLVSALLAVISSDYVYDILKDTDAFCKKLGFNKTPDLFEWLDFYSHEDLFIGFLEIWFIEELKKPAFRNLLGVIITYAQQPARLESLRRNANSISHQVASEDVLRFLGWLEKFDVSALDHLVISDTREINGQFDVSHALHFCIRVMFPCMYFYGETHHTIFKKAINGDIDAICKLLLIDKSVIAAPQIAEIFHDACLNDSNTFGKFQVALGGSKKINSPQRAKGMVAAYISESSKAFGENLTAPQIQDIFDFVASVKRSEYSIDTDLPDTPEEFAKNIQRQAPKYAPLFKLDKN